MPKFKLLAGQHIAADKRQKPTVTKDPATGVATERYPSKTYKAGEVVESDTDLVAKFGAQHFELLGGDAAKSQDRIRELEAEVAQLKAARGGDVPGSPTPENQVFSPSVAPGGQVSSGFQQTSGGVSGPMLPEDVEGAKEGTKAEGRTEGKGKAPAPRHPAPPHNLDHMSVKELQAHAESEEIDLGGATHKEQMVKAIRAHYHHK